MPKENRKYLSRFMLVKAWSHMLKNGKKNTAEGVLHITTQTAFFSKE
jgi:hypothetical protein